MLQLLLYKIHARISVLGATLADMSIYKTYQYPNSYKDLAKLSKQSTDKCKYIKDPTNFSPFLFSDDHREHHLTSASPSPPIAWGAHPIWDEMQVEGKGKEDQTAQNEAASLSSRREYTITYTEHQHFIILV